MLVKTRSNHTISNKAFKQSLLLQEGDVVLFTFAPYSNIKLYKQYKVCNTPNDMYSLVFFKQLDSKDNSLLSEPVITLQYFQFIVVKLGIGK